MRVAVTGGAGYIGSALVRRLMEEGDDVISVDNLMKGDYRHLQKIRGVMRDELRKGDIRDDKLLREIFREADAVAHLAAISDLVRCREMPEEAISVNIYGTHQVLETARELDISKVVFCSSAAVYGRPQEIPVSEGHPLRPLNLYGVTKLAGEKLMNAYHDNYSLETTSLRFGNVYGVGLFTSYDAVIPKFVRQGLGGESLTVYGDGRSSRDFVHIDDIVYAIILALRVEGKVDEVYNVGGETWDIKSLASLVSESLEKSTGRSPGIVYLPPRLGETEQFSYDMEKFKRDFGFKPKWSVREGINQIIGYRINQMELNS